MPATADGGTGGQRRQAGRERPAQARVIPEAVTPVPARDTGNSQGSGPGWGWRWFWLLGWIWGWWA